MNQHQNGQSISEKFKLVFTTYFPAVKYFALTLLKSEEDAEDIAQDVFARLWTQPEIWAENEGIDKYIFVMAKNTTFNFIKHKRIEQAYQEQYIEKSLIEEVFQSDDILEPIYYKEIELIIRLVLSRLPERRREIFESSRFRKMTNLEIAEKFQISVRTVEHQIYLSLQEIKKIIFIAFFSYFI